MRIFEIKYYFLILIDLTLPTFSVSATKVDRDLYDSIYIDTKKDKAIIFL